MCCAHLVQRSKALYCTSQFPSASLHPQLLFMSHHALRPKKEGVLIDRTDLEFEREGVLNPGCLQDGDTIHMYYRAVRPGNYSTIGYCRLNGPLEVVERYDHPLLEPEHDYESQGLEDPRVVKIDRSCLTIQVTSAAYPAGPQ